MINTFNLITLSQAEKLGYGKRDTLQHSILRGNLNAIKIGRDYLTTEGELLLAGYERSTP